MGGKTIQRRSLVRARSCQFRLDRFRCIRNSTACRSIKSPSRFGSAKSNGSAAQIEEKASINFVVGKRSFEAKRTKMELPKDKAILQVYVEPDAGRLKRHVVEEIEQANVFETRTEYSALALTGIWLPLKIDVKVRKVLDPNQKIRLYFALVQGKKISVIRRGCRSSSIHSCRNSSTVFNGEFWRAGSVSDRRISRKTSISPVAYAPGSPPDTVEIVNCGTAAGSSGRIAAK